MSGVYEWHTLLVAAFLAFVLIFVMWGSSAGKPGRGK